MLRPGEAVKRVLIVEDDAHLRRMFRALLENEGFEVREAEDGSQGLALVLSEAPDCIITDTMMPRMDGLAMLRRLAAVRPPVPSIMVTAAFDLPDDRQLKELGVVKVFGKPFAFDRLVEAVRQAVQGS